MKLASLKTGGRDGTLIVVSRDLTQAISVPNIAATLQYALDHWDTAAPALEKTYQALNSGRCKDSFALDTKQLAAPLPRAYQWLDGSAYVTHVELVRKARGVPMPEQFWTDPLMYQGASDTLSGPCDPILIASEAWGIDCESEVAIITGDVPMGVSPEQTAKSLRLFMLVNDVSLRNLIPDELAKGFGFLHGKPATAFSPVAITPDELGNAWSDGRVHLPLVTRINNTLLGQPNAGKDMVFSFPQLIAHAAKTRFLGAGTIIGSGTVSNAERTCGSSCLVEKRMLEILENGKASTEFLHFGDAVDISMVSHTGEDLFGHIQQKVQAYETL